MAEKKSNEKFFRVVGGVPIPKMQRLPDKSYVERGAPIPTMQPVKPQRPAQSSGGQQGGSSQGSGSSGGDGESKK